MKVENLQPSQSMLAKSEIAPSDNQVILWCSTDSSKESDNSSIAQSVQNNLQTTVTLIPHSPLSISSTTPVQPETTTATQPQEGTTPKAVSTWNIFSPATSSTETTLTQQEASSSSLGTNWFTAFNKQENTSPSSSPQSSFLSSPSPSFSPFAVSTPSSAFPSPENSPQQAALSPDSPFSSSNSNSFLNTLKQFSSTTPTNPFGTFSQTSLFSSSFTQESIKRNIQAQQKEREEEEQKQVVISFLALLFSPLILSLVLFFLSLQKTYMKSKTSRAERKMKRPNSLGKQISSNSSFQMNARNLCNELRVLSS